MTHRLLLGTGPLITTVSQSLQEQSGTVVVGTTDKTLANSLQEHSVPVRWFDILNEETLGTLETPDIVGIFDESHSQNRYLAGVTQAVFPDARIVAYDGETAKDQYELERTMDGESSHDPVVGSDHLDAIAESVIKPGEELANHIMSRVGRAGLRMQQLQRALRGIDTLAVVTHDNPDPDAIASGVALARLARRAGCEAEVCYYGDITHQENLAFINVLNLELRNFDPGEDLSEFDGIALVDHSRPGVNDQLPTDTPVDIVIDHHPPRSPIDASFVDLRSSVGATSTLLVDYLDRFNVELDESLATALLFGIHVDTQGFSREISRQDFIAGAHLMEAANFGMLERIETPNISPRTFETIADAISNRRVEGMTLLSCVGDLSERDTLAQAADRLLSLENIAIVLVYGIKDGEIFISARARGANIDLGETLREAFGQIGSAGGHVDMAGAQITLGVLEAVDDREESIRQVVEDMVCSRFLDVLDTKSGPPADRNHMAEAEVDAEYRGESRAAQDHGPTDRSDSREESRASDSSEGEFTDSA